MLKKLLVDRQRLMRLGSHVVWSVLDQVLNIGVQRLVFFPILAQMITEDDFGTFLIALGLIQMIGIAPSQGLMAYVMRDAAKHTPADQRLLIRTSTILTGAAILPFALGLLVATPWIVTAYANGALGWQLPILVVYLALINFSETILCIQRVHRDFRYIALTHAAQSIAVFVALPLLPLMGVIALPLAHSIAAAFALGLQVFHRRGELLETPHFSAHFARDAFSTWWPVSLSTLAWMSAGYLDRILLGLWWPEREVAAFFAAVSTSYIFSVPGAVMSSMIFSLLGKVPGPASFSRSFYVTYALGVLASTAFFGLVGTFLGPYIIGLLYPQLAAEALPIWPLAVTAAVITNLHSLSRPFVVKFFSVHWIPALAWMSIAGRVIPLLLLVPTGGRQGAVIAMLLGAAISAVTWYGVFVYKLILRRSPTDPVRPAADGEAMQDTVDA